MSKLTDKQWVDLASKATYNYMQGDLRLGQSYMIALNDVNRDLYELITASESDCFYQDNNISKFIAFLNNDN